MATMLTHDELKAATINANVVREALDQVSKRLADQLTIKETHERKAFSLFSAYITVAVALLSAGAVLRNAQYIGLPILLFFVGLIFVGGAILFVLALCGDQYGVLGSAPEMWLTRGVIDGQDDVIPKLLTSITFHHKERIDRSVAANDRKAVKIFYGIWVGVAGVALLAIYLAVQVTSL